MRERILHAAERRAADGGLNRLRVGQVAADAGVSRQTVYNEFGDKFGLAQAIAVRVTHRFMDAIDVVLADADSPVDGMRSAITTTLRAAAEQPLIRLAVNRDDQDDMLALMTTDAGPIIQACEQRLSATINTLWPTEHADDVALVVDVAVRTALSHILCPTEPAEASAEKLAKLVETFALARRVGA